MSNEAVLWNSPLLFHDEESMLTVLEELYWQQLRVLFCGEHCLMLKA
jgi:hypothetical protein